jgi:hypothetical protein
MTDMAGRLALFADRVARQDRELPGYADAWQEMTGMILASGGTAVVPPMAPDAMVHLLIKHGAIRVPSRVKFQRGERGGCHVNSARIFLGLKWKQAKADGIGTGYALSPDGLWREHSWAMAGDVIIETTVLREKYWGVILRDEVARDWAQLMMRG